MPIKKSFTDKDFASVLQKYRYNLHPGDIVAGTIFNQESKGFLVDIGANIAGYLPNEEVALVLEQRFNNYLYLVNETREFFILAYNKNAQQLILSIKRLEYIRAWKRIKQLETEDIILNLYIYGTNRGGLITRLEGIQGFIPNSHIGIKENNMNKFRRMIRCQLLIADEKSNKLIFSNKRALMHISKNKLKIGQIVAGKIIKIKTYGLFIQIYGIIALLHISEIGDKHIDYINDIFQLGDIIQVKIIHIDMQQGRLSVSKRNIT